jgi:phenylpropionate dioxygenase-like ring-hydroxylating dioxygenase large terminal subunit
MRSVPQATMRQRDLSVWPRYDAATLGFRNYWYPLTWARRVGSRPRSLRLLGEPIMLRREAGKLHAFYDQCPHRGIPLSVGRQEFPGTWSCRYHGWTYDCATGVLKAALTDGPDSPICGKVRVRTYPVEERAGLVFVWMGDGAPTVPVEEDIPEELLRPGAIIAGRIVERRGNWRLAVENGYDEAHAKFLHRYGALVMMFSRMPGWSVSPGGGNTEGEWLVRKPNASGMTGDYPGLGRWPRFAFWQRPGRHRAVVSVRMPGALRVTYSEYVHYTWYTPIDAEQHRYFQLLTIQGGTRQAAIFHLKYWLFRRWLFHVQFNNQDSWMVELMPNDLGPERLFRPDASITAWRRMCEHARGEGPAADGREAATEGEGQSAVGEPTRAEAG